MNDETNPATTPDAPASDQRELLERSEAEAAEDHPKTYREEANEDKVVEIGEDKQDAPIQGIDPPEGEPGDGAGGDADNRLQE